jgi:antitoxin ParD1/3/4
MSLILGNPRIGSHRSAVFAAATKLTITKFDIERVASHASPMNISLTEQLERFVSEQVQSGAYQSASEVVRDGLRLLAERRKTEELKLAALRAAIREGLDSGPAEPLDMEAIIAEARAGYQRRA